ncbi:S41 family peptidase [Candidatus Marinimicrobia bacterium MT.SAG.4]|nr:S41 family peptidase [Candidatus Marinimicrobia bacterium MT.SAG.4]
MKFILSWIKRGLNQLLKEIVKVSKTLLSYSAIFVFILLLYTGSSLLSAPDNYLKISQGLKLFSQVYKQVSSNYVDEIDPESFIEAAIRGMLKTLDPYTAYYSPENSSGIDMLTTGSYGGVGIRLGMRGDSLTVISPMEGTPAGRSGIIAGDKIIKIDGLSTSGLKLDAAADLIRGPEGEEVELKISRHGFTGTIDFILVREKIILNEVLYSGFVKENIGYIRLTGFSKSSVSKFKESLNKLINDGLEGVIIDLRDNPGGLLDAALKISDMFIDKGELLVSTKGRIRQMNKQHYSKTNPIIDRNVELVVIVNAGSASASEIFAGVVQDLDRGIIVGNKTFGKGLVQSVISLPYKKKVKVTTGKYYIPSGRLIQKEDYFHEGSSIIRDESDSLFATLNGRAVFGGGGITPDVIIENPKSSKLISDLWRKNMFYKYAGIWTLKHPEATAPVTLEDSDVNEFIEFIVDSDFKYDSDVRKAYTSLIKALEANQYPESIVDDIREVESKFYKIKDEFTETDVGMIKSVLSREISERIGRTKGRYESIFLTDKVILRSVELLENNMFYNQTLGYIE